MCYSYYKLLINIFNIVLRYLLKAMLFIQIRASTWVPRLRSVYRSSHPGVFLGKGVLKIYSKFTEEHPCRSAISIKLQSKFIEITCGMGVLLEICCTFSEHLFLWKPLDDCFCDKILRVIQIWWKILTTMVLS